MKNHRKNIVLVVFYYLSTIVGTFPFQFDSSTNLLRFSKFRSTFGILLYGTAVLVTSPLDYMAAVTRTITDVTTKDFALIIEILNEYAKNAVGLISLTLFIWNRNAFLKLFNEILSLDCKTTLQERANLCCQREFSIMVAFRIGLGFLLWILNLGWFLLNFNHINWILIILYCGYTSLFVLQLFAVHYFFIAVALVGKTWQENNFKLLEIYQEYKDLVPSKNVYGLAKDKCATLCDRLDEISKLYRKLSDLHKQIRNLFEVQVLGLVATSFFGNVSSSFSTYTYFYGKLFFWSTLFVFGGLTAASLLDFFLIPWICERSIKSYRNTMEILGRFSRLKALDVRFDATINRILLQVDNLKVSYILCGLFELSHSSAFMVLSSTMTYLLILVQFDYEYGDLTLNDYI